MESAFSKSHQYHLEWALPLVPLNSRITKGRIEYEEKDWTSKDFYSVPCMQII